ncbi:hypothetical protein [Alteromonas sp.]|uniref:hypothetical protein n=1 Tax=Alteromonas sp. TaxID=232 RepID=UPI00257AD7A3|nr:hypothetical protein [Alteromonas sp.]NQY18929.1 hypothetical protein [Alteromonas sp.]|tara:strand:- start:2278 stop:3378 length:1101 start_codon:yes stop_codon:yes gene_type:complete
MKKINRELGADILNATSPVNSSKTSEGQSIAQQSDPRDQFDIDEVEHVGGASAEKEHWHQYNVIGRCEYTFPNGRKITGDTVIIPPKMLSNTYDFNQNPRKILGADPTAIARLAEDIRSTKGNNVAVWARLDKHNKVEVIAGYCRRTVVTQEGLPLKVDLYRYEDISFIEAVLMSYDENDKRNELDPLSNAIFMYKLRQMDEYKSLTMDEFGACFKYTRTHASLLVNIGKIPLFITRLLPDRHRWNFESLKIFKNLVSKRYGHTVGRDVEYEENSPGLKSLELALIENKPKTPEATLTLVRSLLGKKDSELEPIKLGDDGRYGSVKYSASGAVTINLNKKFLSEHRDKAEDLVQELVNKISEMSGE